MPSTLFFRLLDAEDKGTALQEVVAALPQNPTPEAFAVNPESFEQVPCSPFAYWADNRTRNLFSNLPPVEGNDRTIKQGLKTASDFRFARLIWELPPQLLIEGSDFKELNDRSDFSNLSRACIASTFKGKNWVPLAKGGAYSRYYSDVHLAIH